MSDTEVFVGLATIVTFGVGAQWIGRRTGVPSLLILLPAGLLAGDVLDLVRPEELFGDLLFPGVTLLVSLLLFQSGLQLRIRDLPGPDRGSVARLVSIGAAVTFVGASVAVVTVLDVPTDLAFLTGAILVVSGPTVVGPLLAVVRPREPTGTVLRWEGTILDPVGATLGVVVLNLILASERAGLHPLVQMSARLGLGVALGLVAAALLVFVMSRFLLTDDMEAAVALLLAVVAFTLAEIVLSEAGLFATMTMGVAVANQRLVPIGRIRGFGETLEVLIIGGLFVVLGALVKIDDLVEYAAPVAVIVALLVVVVRPLAAATSLVRTPLTARERGLVGWMDPRGIVAAATAAQFSSSLADAGFDADFLVPVVFGVIVGTGVVYGLTAPPVARLLGVARPSPTGVGLVGDDPWLAPFGRCLADAGVSTLLVTHEPPETNDLPRSIGRISLRDGTERIERAVTEADIGQAVISVPSDAALTLLESGLIERLGRRHVLRVARSGSGLIPERFSARPFGDDVSRTGLDRRIAAGATVQVVTDRTQDRALLLAAVDPGGVVNLSPTTVHPGPDDTLIGLVDAPP